MAQPSHPRAVRSRIGAVLLLLTGALLVGAVVFAPWIEEKSPANPDDARKVAAGKAVYDRHCAACHGARLEGQPNWRGKRPDGRMPAPPHDASGHTWHHPDAVLFGITRDGLAPGKYAPPGYRSDMPAFGALLSDAEIWSVLAYIKSSWPAEIREAQAGVDREYRSASRPGSRQ